MGTTVGIGVVIAILVLLPLGAVWAAGRWRDPPPEKWGVSRPDVPDPGAVEVRLRKQYKLVGDSAWAPVRRAAFKGELAPEGLRAPAAEYAAARARAIESQLSGRAGRVAWVMSALTIVAVPTAVVVAIVARNGTAAFYAVYLTVLWVFRNPWVLRLQVARARRAVEVNGG